MGGHEFLRGAATVSMQFRHFAYLGILRYEDTTGCLPFELTCEEVRPNDGATRQALSPAPGASGSIKRRASREGALPYAARRSSFTSTSLQAEHARTSKPGSPPVPGTARTSFMTSPQHRQRKMGRLSGKTIVFPPMQARQSVVAPAKLRAEMLRKS